MPLAYLRSPTGTLKYVRRMAVALIFLVGGAAAVAATDPKDQKPAKPSSFAPHHTGKRVYGAPIQHPILHKRHKASPKTSKPNAVAPGQRTDSGVH